MQQTAGLTRGFHLVACVAVLQLVLVGDAQAYLDPGTGSFIFQTVVAMALGAAFTAKYWWQRMKSIFTGRTERRVDDLSQSTDNESGGG
jgi:hypothetical protein